MNSPKPYTVIPGKPSSVTVECEAPDCHMEIVCEIDVQVILKPAANGHRLMYALSKPNTQPIWDHILAFHGPEEYDEVGEYERNG